MYDVLLGMPWHFSQNPNFNCQPRVMISKDVYIPAIDQCNGNRIDLFNLGVNNFRLMIRRRGDIEVLKLIQVQRMRGIKISKVDRRLEKLSNKHEGIFRNEVPSELLSIRAVHHGFKVEGAK